MIDVFDVADVFVRHAIKTHGDEVGLIAYYGSYATGHADPTSDLDLIYIPDEGKAASLAACFVLDGRCFDFFPISWERAERLANGTPTWAVGPALIANARVLYARSEEDRARFQGLKDSIAALQRPESKPQMVARALDMFKQAVFQLGNLRLALEQDDAESVRCAAWRVVTTAVDCLALVSQVTFSRGWDANLPEMLRLPRRPAALEQLVLAVATAPDAAAIAAAAESLVRQTREILATEQAALPRRPGGVAETFADHYPETKGLAMKIAKRSEAGEVVGASWVATIVQDEISMFMEEALTGAGFSDFNIHGEYAGSYRAVGLPALSEGLAQGGPQELASRARALDAGFRAWLTGHGVSPNELDGLQDLARFLEAREGGGE